MPKTEKTLVRAMSLPVEEEQLKADLAKYHQKALEFGASAAEIIPVDWVHVDERVRLKCSIPACPNYNRCGYCPPHVPELDFIRKAFERYHWAVLFKSDVPVEDFADIKRYYPHGQKQQRKTDEIAARIETVAFSEGYRFALGLGSGGCRDTFCNGGLCSMLDSGRCRCILMARPSMEAVAIDVCDLANKVGWKVYPVYRTCDPKCVPAAVSIGMVFIH